MPRLRVLALASFVATAGALALAAGPAAAHVCPIAAQIRVGQPATIDVGVTVEGTAVPDVEITVPTGLRLDRVDPKAGWTTTRTGATVRYRGGPIDAFACEYFSLGVTAPARGSFGIPVVLRAADGHVVASTTPDPNRSEDRVLDQFVYAGVKPPAAPSTSKGLSTTTIVGIALVGGGTVAFAVLGFRAFRARRAGDEEGDGEGESTADREAELRARLERFRERTPDHPPE